MAFCVDVYAINNLRRADFGGRLDGEMVLFTPDFAPDEAWCADGLESGVEYAGFENERPLAFSSTGTFVDFLHRLQIITETCGPVTIHDKGMPFWPLTLYQKGQMLLGPMACHNLAIVFESHHKQAIWLGCESFIYQYECMLDVFEFARVDGVVAMAVE